jgi:DNA-binding beta-propeller fold protein YncE
VLLAGTALIVADTGNNRVLVFAAPPTSSGASATAVLGQPDFQSRTPAANGSDLTRLSGPVALASDGVWLYVADRDLGRIATFALPATQSGAAAVTTYGSLQGDRGLALQGPAGLAVDVTPYFTTRLYIADSGQNRIVTLSSLSRLLPLSQ